MTEKLLSVTDVAEYLGLTKMGVYGLVFKGKIPAVKISKRCLRFNPSDIETWIRQKTKQPKTQLAQQQPFKKSPGRPRKNGAASDSKEVLGVELI